MNSAPLKRLTKSERDAIEAALDAFVTEHGIRREYVGVRRVGTGEHRGRWVAWCFSGEWSGATPFEAISGMEALL